MSVEATAAVWAMRGLTGTEKVVAVRIADHASPDGRDAYPSVRRLALDTGLSERTVQTALASLVTKGVLSRDHRPGPKGTRRYSVNLTWKGCSSRTPEGTAPPQEPHPAAAAPPKDAHPTPAVPAPQEVQQLHPNRQVTVREPSTTHLPAVAGTVQGVFDAWRESTGHHRAVLDKKRTRLIAQALNKYPLDYVLAAVAGWKYSPHHRGENERHTVYNDLELILRDAKHIEQFAELAIAGANGTDPSITRAKGFSAIQRAAGRGVQ